MAATTQLSCIAVPGKRYVISAKTAATVWTKITIKGIDAISGKVVYIIGQYKVGS